MQSLFTQAEGRFPSTRYQGSKVKLIDWIWDSIKNLKFETALDAFGGTGAVSYKLKKEGKDVSFNDALLFNCIIAKALIENDYETVTKDEFKALISFELDGKAVPDIIHRNFSEIYYTEDENVWLDRFIHKLQHSSLSDTKKSIILFALYQSCIIKRPYNLFHRKNLYMRFAEVERSFGNKSSWDRSFEDWLYIFLAEANEAVFKGKKKSTVYNLDALDIPNGFDLVYFDPPYFNSSGLGTDYLGFYHFLEGISIYHEWEAKIDYKSKHRRLINKEMSFSSKKRILDDFSDLCEHHAKSIIVVSYREDGLPTPDQIAGILRSLGKKVSIKHMDYQYALSKTLLREVLIIGE